MSFFTKLQNAGSAESALAFLQNRFQKNLAFFQRFIPQYAKILEHGAQNYRLEISDDDINILDLNQNAFLYEPGEFFSVNEAFGADPIKSPLWTKILTKFVIEQSETSYAPITAKITSAITALAQKDADYEMDSFSIDTGVLPPLVIYGLASGLFLERILERRELHGVLLYEPSADFFVLSAHFLDYENLYAKTKENSCYIIVGGKLDTKIVRNFFATRLITNSPFRLELATYSSARIKDAQAVVEEIAKSATRGWGTFEDEMIGVKNKLKNYRSYPYLFKRKILPGTACVVGNAPSLEKDLDFLRAHQDEMMIFCSGSALGALRKHGIKPDFQVEVERLGHLQRWLNAARLDDIPLIASDIADPSTLQSAQTALLYIRGSSASAAMFEPKLVLEFAAPLSGNASLSVAGSFFKEILLVGMDLGFKRSAKQHARGSLYDALDDTSPELLPTRGNFGGDIYTNSLLSMARGAMERLIQNERLNVRNLSDGVYIKGAKPLPPGASIDLSAGMDKAALKREILECFSSSGVFGARSTNYQEILDAYKQEFLRVLRSKPVTSKAALLERIDLAYYKTTAQRISESVSGTLVCGTFWHVLNAIFTALMQIKRQDVSAIFDECCAILEENLADLRLE